MLHGHDWKVGKFVFFFVFSCVIELAGLGVCLCFFFAVIGLYILVKDMDFYAFIF